MKQKIIISSYDDINNPHYGGGGAGAIHEIAKRLIDEYEVTVVTGSYSKSADGVVDTVSYKRIGMSIFGPKIGQLLFSMLLPILAVFSTYDLWLESFTPPFSTSFIPLFAHRPVIGLVHMLGAEDMQRKYKIPFNLFQTIESIGLKLYKHFIVLTEDTKKKIQGYNKQATYLLCPNGITLPECKIPYQKRDQKHILFMGRIEINQKGIDLLLDSIRKIRESLHLKLIIAGSGEREEMDALHALVKTHGLSNQIQVVGKVNGLQKELLYEGAAVCVVPSRYETFSMVALESMSYKIPLIAFDIPGLAWIPENAVVKVPCFYTDRLSSVILELSRNRDRRNEISLDIPDLGGRYTWKSVISEYKQYISHIIGNSSLHQNG